MSVNTYEFVVFVEFPFSKSFQTATIYAILDQFVWGLFERDENPFIREILFRWKLQWLSEHPIQIGMLQVGSDNYFCLSSQDVKFEGHLRINLDRQERFRLRTYHAVVILWKTWNPFPKFRLF